MSDDNDAEIARDTPNAPVENAVEFRGGRSNGLSLIWNVAALAMLFLLYVLQLMPRRPSTFILIFAGAWVLFQVFAYVVSGRCRLLVNDRELHMTSGPYSRVIPFADVRAAELIEDRKHLVLHLADGTATPIPLGFYWRPAEARRAIESCLSEPITTTRSRVDLAARPVAVIVLSVAVLVFAGLFVYFMWPPGPVAFLAYGFGGGFVLSFVLMRAVPTQHAKRYLVSIACFAAFAVLVAFFTWLYLPEARRAVEVAITKAVLLVIGFGPGLAIPQAIARVSQTKTEACKTVEPPK